MKSNPNAAKKSGLSIPATPGVLATPGRRVFYQDVLIVLAVSLAVRFLFMLVMPSQARSTDAHNWESVAHDLSLGNNPYQHTSLLNWPPLWFQVLFLISKVSTFFSLPFFRVLQGFLIIIESAVIVLLIKLIRAEVPQARVRLLLIIAIALNPVAVLLICQHCNFDVVVALWLVLFMLGLLQFNRTENYEDWLGACLFLGLGILTKTVPLILVPLLVGGFRKASLQIKFLGAALVFGPTALGISVLYVLSPADVASKVLQYRGISGNFGISGLIHLAGLDSLAGLYGLLFYLLLFTALVGLSILFWRLGSIGNRETVLLAFLILACIPVLGPAYAPQYFYWFLPFLVATYVFYDGKWRRILVFFGFVAAVTYLFEYAVLGSDGASLINFFVYTEQDPQQAAALVPVIGKYQFPPGQTMMRLPLFLAWLIVLSYGTAMLVENIKKEKNV